MGCFRAYEGGLQEKDQQQAEQIRRNTQAVFRAMEGWQRVGSQDEWVKVCRESQTEYESGQFLLDRLGAERYLDPKLIATLLSHAHRRARRERSCSIIRSPAHLEPLDGSRHSAAPT